MRARFAIGVALALTAISVNACEPDSLNNYYCSAIDSLAFTGFDLAGSYNEVTSMASGGCSSQPKTFSGPLAPLDGEVWFPANKNHMHKANAKLPFSFPGISVDPSS